MQGLLRGMRRRWTRPLTSKVPRHCCTSTRTPLNGGRAVGASRPTASGGAGCSSKTNCYTGSQSSQEEVDVALQARPHLVG